MDFAFIPGALVAVRPADDVDSLALSSPNLTHSPPQILVANTGGGQTACARRTIGPARRRNTMNDTYTLAMLRTLPQPIREEIARRLEYYIELKKKGRL